MKWTRRAISSAVLALTIAGPGGHSDRRSAAGPTPPGAPAGGGPIEAPSKKIALLVGINQYKSSKIPPLRGAVNDVVGMRELLVGRFGFRAEDVVVKTDEEATHEAVVRAFREHLIAKADQRTVALFYFSGYGSRMRDVDGDELDRWDETIVPYDSRQGSVFDIDDDEQGELFDALRAKTRYVTAVFDCGLANVPRPVVDGQGPRTRGIVEITPSRLRSLPVDNRPPPAPRRPGRQPGTADGHAHARIFASDDGEQAYEDELGGESHGIFSHFFAEELRRPGAQGATYRDVIDRVVCDVRRVQFAQRPTLDGDGIDRVVFDLAAIPAPRYQLVAMDGIDVKVLAGRVHGLTPGSTLALFPPGSKAMDAAAKPAALIRLLEVNTFDSRGRLISGGPVGDAARAVERGRREDGLHIRLYLDETTNGRSPVLAALRSHLETTPGLSSTFEPVGRNGRPDFILRRHLADADGRRVAALSLYRAGEEDPAVSLPEYEPRLIEKLLAHMLHPLMGESSDSRQVAPIGGGTYPARIHGLFIGIDKYAGGGRGMIRNLSGCVNDATAMYDALGDITTQRIPLSNEKATRRAILEAISKLVRESQENDLIIVFLSSHGTIAFGDYYIVPHDFDADQMLSTGLAFGVVADALNSKKGVKSLIIIDSCHSGQSGFNVSRYRSDEHQSSVMVSSSPNEVSLEKRRFGRFNGLFAGSLIEGLDGPADDNGDGKITIRELFDFAYAATKSISWGGQHPVFFGSLDQNIILKSVNVKTVVVPEAPGGRRGPAGGLGHAPGPTQEAQQ